MLSDKELVKVLKNLKDRLSYHKNETELLRKQYNNIESIIYAKLKNLPVGSYIVGNDLVAVINKTEVYSINSWSALLKYVVKFRRFDLIPKKINSKACNELLINGFNIQGIRPYKKLGIKLVPISEVKNGKNNNL